MRPFNQHLLGLSTLILCLSSTAEAWQQRDTRCKHFQELIRQEGLKIETKLLEHLLAPAEIMQPVVVVKNQSQKHREIPDFEAATGIFVDALEGLNYYRPVLASSEEPFCSFATVVLAPGEEREFLIRAQRNELFAIEDANLPFHAPSAMDGAGKHSYELHLGRMRVNGQYTVESLEIEDYTCLEKKVIQEPKRDTSPAIRVEQYCQPAFVSKIGGERYLMSELLHITTSQYANLLRQLRKVPGSNNLEFSTPAPLFRIAKLAGPSTFAISRSSQIVSREMFGIIGPGLKPQMWAELKDIVEAQRKR